MDIFFLIPRSARPQRDHGQALIRNKHLLGFERCQKAFYSWQAELSNSGDH
jgi:hypothetical protein